MSAVSRLGPGGYPRPPYGSFAGKNSSPRPYIEPISVLGPGGYPRPPYGSFNKGPTPPPPTLPTGGGGKRKPKYGAVNSFLKLTAEERLLLFAIIAGDL